MNTIRIGAIVVRQLLLFRHSLHRVFNVFYWTTLELFLWGFLTFWLRNVAGQDTGVNFALLLLGGLIFWSIFSRSQTNVSLAFLEDLWTRNIVNIFASPITSREYLAGLVAVAFIQSSIAFLSAAILAALLYAFGIFTLGIYLLPFIANLFVFGIALGFVVIGLVLRFGHSLEVFAWSLAVLIQPLSAVFYPVNILPEIFQRVAFFLPTMHLFEGMRHVLVFGEISHHHIFWATALNIVYIGLALVFFRAMMHAAKRKGFLVRLATE